MLNRIRQHRHSTLVALQARKAVQSVSFASANSEAKPESDHEHEKKAASESASFFAEGLKATAGHAKEKVASAMGLSDKKPISDGEDMGPAGHMQGRDPNANAEDEYKSLKAKSNKGWDKAGQDKPPNQHYPGHGQNS